MDRLESMALFIDAIEAGSLSAAARRRGLSVSMAGKHLAQLEGMLDARLLHRSTRRLSLTDVGQAYYLRCKRILEDVDEADQEARAAQQGVQGVMRVAAPVTFGALHLGDVMALFLQQHPSVNIEVMLSDRYVDLLASGIDVAIRIGRLPDSGLVSRQLAPCRMVFCAAPCFLTRVGAPRTVADVQGLPRLAFSEAVSSGDWSLTDPEGQAHVICGPLRLSANNTQMLLGAAVAGAGVAYGPSFVFAQAISDGALAEVLPDHKTSALEIHALFPTKRHVSAKVRAFLRLLVETFGGDPPWDGGLKSGLS